MPRRAPPRPTTFPSNSLERALAILEKVASRPGGLSNKQISEELKIATSTSSYILQRLEGEGYLARHAVTGRYEIGLKVLAIARGALRQINFGKIAEPLLRRVSANLNLETLIGVLDQERLLVVGRVPTEDFAGDDVDTGTEFPAHAMSTGKLLLAHLPIEEVVSMVKDKKLVRFTAKTITSIPDLLADLDQVRTRGYAVSDEEYSLGMRSVAVPIVDSGRGVMAALAAIGSTRQPAWRDTAAVLTALKAAAQEISRSSGKLGVHRLPPRSVQ